MIDLFFSQNIDNINLLMDWFANLARRPLTEVKFSIKFGPKEG